MNDSSDGMPGDMPKLASIGTTEELQSKVRLICEATQDVAKQAEELRARLAKEVEKSVAVQAKKARIPSHDIPDLRQEVLCAVEMIVRKAEASQQPPHVASWGAFINGVSRNLAIKMAAKRRQMEALPETATHAGCDPMKRAMDRDDLRATLDDLRKKFGALTVKIVLMRAAEESFADICKKLNISYPNCIRRNRVALEYLRRKH